MSDKVLSLLGICARAGKVESGGFCTERAVKAGRARLVIAAGDASENTKKDFRDMCTYYRVPFGIYGTRDSLGHAIGKEERAVLAAADEGLAKEIYRHLTEGNRDGITDGRNEYGKRE